MQRKLAVLVHHSVASIRSALVPHYVIGMLRQQIDYFAFAFVTPLRPYNCFDWHDNRSFDF